MQIHNYVYNLATHRFTLLQCLCPLANLQQTRRHIQSQQHPHWPTRLLLFVLVQALLVY